MGSNGDWERKIVMNELMQGHELTKQLWNHLSPSSPAELLTQKILSSFNTAISMLKSGDWDGVLQMTGPNSGVDSPHSVSGSPCSENSNRAFRDPDSREISKKRKALPKWSEQVRVSLGTTGIEGPPDDGYSWRKYGQKDILGAKYPRAYYRCTHRPLQGCTARKQVQRSEEDSLTFNIMYQGTHTCTQATHQIPPSASQEPQAKKQKQEPQKEVLLNFRTGLKVKTEDLVNQDLNSSSFSFPCASPIDSGNPGNSIFSSSSLETHFMGTFSPPFISPATSESNYFSVSPCYGGGPNMPTSESDFNEIISAVTSASNSSMGDLDLGLDLDLDLDFTLEQFDPNFKFDASTFL